jgi:hypothetical protein
MMGENNVSNTIFIAVPRCSLKDELRAWSSTERRDIGQYGIVARCLFHEVNN